MHNTSVIPLPPLTSGIYVPAQPAKKRRLQGSCDECRRKKTRCDSAEMPGNKCTNCDISNIQCTHEMPRQPKKTETQQAYIQVLEDKIAKLERFIRRLYPEEESIDRIISMAPSGQIQNSPYEPNTQREPDTFTFGNLNYPLMQSISSDRVADISTSTQDESQLLEADDLAHVALAEHLGVLSLNAVDDRFYGQASAFMFAKEASTLRSKVTGENPEPDPRRYRRPVYWDMRPWELTYATSSETCYIYPDNDLLKSLVALYFEKTNSIIPILHEPTFMKSLTLGQHHWDPSFGMTVLIVCAIGSKYSQDSRVFVPNDKSRLSAGWHYFCQVPMHRKIMLYKSSIYDLQYYVLAPLYLVGSSMPHTAWNILGIGLRYALEKGAHRRKGVVPKPSVESELQKRAFWSLVCLDRMMNSFVGRPSGLPHETFDVEYPIECDDEFWETEDPEKAFQQPPGKPCMITAFVCFIKLGEILGFALRTLYTNKKSKILSGFVGVEWEGQMVAELDSSMNKWRESLPDYLRWDPDRQDANFFHQSVNLNATFYYIQIQIHRPFLTKGSPLSFSSLAMCTNAARCCTHILEAAMSRGIRELPNLMTVAFTAGILVAVGLWGSQKTGFIGNSEKEIQYFQKCINVLQDCEKRWHCAGRLCDMLKEAASIHQYAPTPPTAKRRRRSFDKELLPQPPTPSTEIYGSTDPFSIESNAFLQSDTSTPNPVNQWDLRKLLFTELNCKEGNAADDKDTRSNTNVGGHTDQPQDISTPSTGEHASDIPSGTDMFALWSDIPTAFSCFEEWDAYLASVVQP